MTTLTTEERFENIRPLNDDEVHQALKGLVENPYFKKIIEYVYPKTPWPLFSSSLLDIHTKREFQLRMIYPFGRMLAEKVMRGLDMEGTEKIDKNKNYIYISNHRDIVLDSLFLNILLVEHGLDTTEIALGDNLLVYPWIRTIVRLNKCFVVLRDLPLRQLLEASKTLSAYVHYTIKEKKESIWIAQREGRAKNSDDHTQESVLKMLTMSGEGNFIESIKSLNIVPTSISYEYDPCDYLKAQELHIKRDNPDYKKSQYEDLTSMETGIFGFKGRSHFEICTPLNELITEDIERLPKNECVKAVAQLIDKQIHLNYRFYPNNYIAYDLLTHTNRFVEKYTDAEKTMFEAYISMQMNKIIRIFNKDNDFLKTKLLEMYANPLINHLIAVSN